MPQHGLPALQTRQSCGCARRLFVTPAKTVGKDHIGRFDARSDLRMDIRATVVASRNDLRPEFKRAVDLVSLWGRRRVDLDHAGHVNLASELGAWAAGKKMWDWLVAATARPPVFSARAG